MEQELGQDFGVVLMSLMSLGVCLLSLEMRLMSLRAMRVSGAVRMQGRCGRMMLAACSVQRGRSHAAGHAIYAPAKTRIPLHRTRTQMNE